MEIWRSYVYLFIFRCSSVPFETGQGHWIQLNSIFMRSGKLTGHEIHSLL